MKDHRGKELKEKYGMLKPLCFGYWKDRPNKERDAIWVFKCDCGKTAHLQLSRVKSGHTRSCCFKKGDHQNKTHNLVNSPEYKTWAGIKRRCYNTKDIGYKSYGQMGVLMSDSWKNSFESFLDDMGKKPSKYHSIDRIDNTKGYSKENCRWATQKEQARNRQWSYWIEINGEKKHLAEWVEIFNSKLPYTTILGRIKKGFDPIEAITKDPEPVPILELNGDRMRIFEWAKKLNIPSYIIKNRLKIGWSVEDALTTPVNQRNKRT